MGEDPMAQVVHDNRRSIEAALLNVRDKMREDGLRPPALPAELTHIEPELSHIKQNQLRPFAARLRHASVGHSWGVR
jgi:hypothetical protein